MKIAIKKMKNPKFQHIQVIGTLLQIVHINDQQEVEKTYVVESKILELKYSQHVISIKLSETGESIDKIRVCLDDKELEFSGLGNLTDCLEMLSKLKVSDYWKNEQMQLYIFLLLRVVIPTVTAQKMGFYKFLKTKKDAELIYWIKNQKQLSTILLCIFESVNIDTSGFIVNKRAEHLLVLGLNPREQYTTNEIRQFCRPLLKLVHPDVPLGNPDLFKRIQQAQQYLK